jgi:hypothetical protein
MCEGRLKHCARMQIILAFILGAITSILATALFEWLKRPILSIAPETPPFDKQYGAGHSIARQARFLRVIVENREPRRWFRWLSRHAALACEADINFLHLDQRDVFGKAMPGRWTGWPEPLAYVGEVGGQSIHLVNPYFMAPQFRRIDIYSGAPGILDVAVRFDDDQECYGWTTENYNYKQWRNPDWKLLTGRYLVRINVRADAAAASAVFLLVNDTAIGTFRLDPIIDDRS